MGVISRGDDITDPRDGDNTVGASGVSATGTDGITFVGGVIPLCQMPLIDDLSFLLGTGPATHTRSTIATFLDFDDSEILKTAAINVARFESPNAVINEEFYKTETNSTNEALHNRDFTNAVHVKTNITAVKDATGLDDIANSASTLTATAANGTFFQTVTKVSDENTYSIDVRRLTGTGVVELSDDGGSTFTDITAIINSTSAYSRFEITSTQANPSFGGRIVTSGDEIEVDFQQLETFRCPTSRIETGAIPVSRTNDLLTIPVVNIPADADFSIAIDFVATETGVASMAWGLEGLGITRHFISGNGGLRMDYNNSGDSLGGFNFDTLVKTAFAYSKGDAEFNHYAGGSKDPDAPIAVTPDATAITTIYIGASQAGGENFTGWLRNFRTWDVQLTDEEAIAEV